MWCLCSYLDRKYTKLDSKSIKCIFLGNYKEIICCNNFNHDKKKIIKIWDVKFVEVKQSKKKRIIEVNNENVEYFIDWHDSSSKSKNVSVDKLKDVVGSTTHHLLFIKKKILEACEVLQIKEL